MSNDLWHIGLEKNCDIGIIFGNRVLKSYYKKYCLYITRSSKMRKVSPCPVCQMEFSSYKESQIHFKTEHREWQRVIWRTQNNIHKRRQLDQRLQRMKQDEKVSKNILRQQQYAIVQAKTKIRYIRKIWRKQLLCEGGGILKITRNVTLPGFGSRGPIKNQ